jgi:hypothetical protein
MKDLTGESFYSLVVLFRASSNRQGSATWLCQCVCGNQKVFSTDHLTRKTNPVKSCGCQRIKRGKDHAQWKGVGDISGNWWYNHVQRSLFGKERRAYLEGDLTINEAWELFNKQNSKCALSGVLLSIGDLPTDNASLDRIDSSKGYTLLNVQWVDKHINFMKRTYSQDFFIRMCERVTQYQSPGGVCEIPQRWEKDAVVS